MADHLYCYCDRSTHNNDCPYKTEADWESDTRQYHQDVANRQAKRNAEYARQMAERIANWKPKR